MKTRKLLFNDKMKVFPTQKPVQDLTEDDYIFFAEAWAILQEQRCNPSNISNADSLHTRPTKKARCERTTGHDGQHPTTMHLPTGDSARFTRGQNLYHKASAVNKKNPSEDRLKDVYYSNGHYTICPQPKIKLAPVLDP
jgi:hypothetical protein